MFEIIIDSQEAAKIVTNITSFPNVHNQNQEMDWQNTIN